jgi:hypothetical protein
MLNARLSPDLMPLATRLGVRPLYGDIHNHCNISYGHGRLQDALNRAKQQLDFVSITGHAHWPDMPVDEPSVAHIVDFHVKGFAKLKKNWLPHYQNLQAINDEGSFCVFPGYEIHSGAHGDYTIVYETLDPQEFHVADDPKSLLDVLKENATGDFLAFPHHIGYRHGARGINWQSFEPALSPFVEMFSMHGCAENSQTDRPYLHSMGPTNGASTMQQGLDGDKIFGIVGNSDHHSAYPGSYGHGRCCVYAPSVTRDAIWSGLKARHTNALTGDRIHLLGAIDVYINGDVLLPKSQATLSIEAVAGGTIDYIDVVRNGALYERISPALQPQPIKPEHDQFETILVIEMGWGARSTTHHWKGTVSLKNGEMLSVEPRLRGREIVSPLEGEDAGSDEPELSVDGDVLSFNITAEANPNNMTPATQAIAIRVRGDANTILQAELDHKMIELDFATLLNGAISGNLGPIDSPAYRIHQIMPPSRWQWHGDIDLGALEANENIYLRLRQTNGQMAWTSPLFCRDQTKA